MRLPAGQVDSAALLDTAAAALEICLAEFGTRGSAAVERMVALDDLSQAHLRGLLSRYLKCEDHAGAEHAAWRAGACFLHALQQSYRVALEQGGSSGLQRGVRLVLMVRRLQAAADLLKWRALAYYRPEPDFWEEVIRIGRMAWTEGVSNRQVRPRRGRSEHTSIDRELARIVALGCAGLDQLRPETIAIADRVLKYAAPVLRLSRSGGDGARFVLPLAPASAPRRAPEHGDAGIDGIYLWPGEAAAALEELASVVAKGLVPAVLSSGPEAREQVLTVAHHLVGLWSGPRRVRRHRRHPIEGRLRALLGFQQLHSNLISDSDAKRLAEGWGMLDASRNGIGLRVPAADCDRIVVGDMLGVRAEDGKSWHVGIVRRIVRSECGDGIVGVETIAKSVSVASIDNGRTLTDALVCDPVHRGSAVRVAQVATTDDGGDDGRVFLSQDGRICKLRRLATLLRANGYELTNYHVL
ncbi:MAG: hypothetical protein KDH15_06185 [Rhodocyclaceae bacterium]|nr:hypothetical protein [Rhodocyclaceae bacterium]